MIGTLECTGLVVAFVVAVVAVIASLVGLGMKACEWLFRRMSDKAKKIVEIGFFSLCGVYFLSVLIYVGIQIGCPVLHP